MGPRVFSATNGAITGDIVLQYLENHIQNPTGASRWWFSLLMKYAPTAVRSGVIGTLIGAIPGAGANVASFLSYAIAKRRANPEERAKWGKGSYEAIVSAEVANIVNIGGLNSR